MLTSEMQGDGWVRKCHTRSTVGVGGDPSLSQSPAREGCSSLGERKLALETKDLAYILESVTF